MDCLYGLRTSSCVITGLIVIGMDVRTLGETFVKCVSACEKQTAIECSASIAIIM